MEGADEPEPDPSVDQVAASLQAGRSGSVSEDGDGPPGGSAIASALLLTLVVLAMTVTAARFDAQARQVPLVVGIVTTACLMVVSVREVRVARSRLLEPRRAPRYRVAEPLLTVVLVSLSFVVLGVVVTAVAAPVVIGRRARLPLRWALLSAGLLLVLTLSMSTILGAPLRLGFLLSWL